MTRRRASRQDTLIDPFGYNFSIDAPRNFSSRELVNIRGHADAFRVQVRSGVALPGGEREMKRCLQKREVVRFWQIGILA